MKTKRTIAITAIIAALAIMAAFGIFRQTTPVKAQDQQPPPLVNAFLSEWSGLTTGRRCVSTYPTSSRTNDSNLPPGPSRVVMKFRLRTDNWRATGAARSFAGSCSSTAAIRHFLMWTLTNFRPARAACSSAPSSVFIPRPSVTITPSRTVYAFPRSR